MPSLEKSIIVLAGLPLSGKTTLGNELSAKYNVPFFDIDETRQEIIPGNEWLGAEKEREIMLATYRRNHEKAGKALSLGKAVILAATYSREAYHEMIRHLAEEHNAPLRVLLLDTPDTVVTSRLQHRLQKGSTSNIVSMDSYAEVRDRYNAYEGTELSVVDTSHPIESTIKAIEKELPLGNE